MGKNKKSVLLIQPHSDDILFSASKFLFNRNDYDKVVLFTTENDEKRLKEDAELAELFDLKLISGTKHVNDLTYYEYYKVQQFKEFSYENSDTLLKKIYDKQYLKDIKSEIQAVAKKYQSKGFEIVVCLGIGHPMHWFIRKCLENYATLYYRDFPHSYKRKTQNCLKETLNEFKITEVYESSEEEHEMKFKIAYNVYKSQRSLLFFEKGYIDKKISEEFYVKIK